MLRCFVKLMPYALQVCLSIGISFFTCSPAVPSTVVQAVRGQGIVRVGTLLPSCDLLKPLLGGAPMSSGSVVLCSAFGLYSNLHVWQCLGEALHCHLLRLL